MLGGVCSQHAYECGATLVNIECKQTLGEISNKVDSENTLVNE